MIVLKMVYVTLLHLNASVSLDFQEKIVMKDLARKTVEESKKVIVIMENVSVSMDLLVHLVISKLVLTHVLITENALKVNVNVNQDTKV